MKIRQYSAKIFFSKSSPAKIYKSIWMILGPLDARSQRAFNAPNHIDFLWLKPEEIVKQVNTMRNVKKRTVCAMI